MSPSAGKNIPPEITEAILRLLPAKSLGRFKSVSKTWNSFISDPLFIKTHLLHNHPTRTLIALSTTGSLYSIHITETRNTDDNNDIPATARELSIGSPPIRWKQILGSCNGFVLAKDENDTIFLMNPTTQDLCKLPLCPFAPPPNEEEVYVKYGFGYDSSTDDYKIVTMPSWHHCSMHHDSKETFECVYSLRNNSWRKLPEYNYRKHDHTVLDVINGASVNQSLHWISRSFWIVGFNLPTEEFNAMKLPDSDPFHNGKPLGYDLVDFGGKLGVSMSSEVCTELCVMEEYGVADSWTTMRIPGLEKILWPERLFDGRSREVVFQEHEGKVVVYNIDERRFRDVRIAGWPSGDVNVFGGTFVESLESPKRIMIAS